MSNTYILFSVAADLSLSLVLLALWLRRRNEWQALYWAVGQSALSANTYLMYLAPADWPRLPLSALTLALALAALWAGAESLLGTLTAAGRRRLLAVCALLSATLYLLWQPAPAMASQTIAWLLGTVMGWCGLRLCSARHFRLLGAVLLLRGLFNLANGSGLVPTDFTLWLAFSVLIKSAWMLLLVNAVQAKILHRHRQMIDSLVSSVLVLDHEQRIHQANRQCALLFGAASPAQLAGRRLTDYLSGPIIARVQDYLAHYSRGGQPAATLETTTARTAAGVVLPLDLIAAPYRENGQRYCMLQLIDVTERARKDEQLAWAARHDSTTGLLNRFGLSQALLAPPQAYAVLFLDIDRFHRINDWFGHAVGDQLLRQVGQRLFRAMPPDSLVARFGADEFVVVLFGAAAGLPAQAGALVPQLRSALGDGVRLDSQTFPLSLSIGIACQARPDDQLDSVLAQAEIAMYAVKKSGRGSTRLYDPAMDARTGDALLMDAALRRAIPAGELRLAYQPIVDAAGGRLRKVEALARWHSPTLGDVPPDRFIALAEESDLIIELGNWVLDEACRQLAAWGEEAAAVVVSVNISPRQLVDQGFVAQVDAILARHGVAPQRLELELTERVLIDDGAHAQAVLDQLDQRGIRIALDDFGTGYSSLSYLTQFHIHTLKIDRSFITDLVPCQRSRNLVAAIVGMGQGLGLELVAEGVETAQQSQALRSMGCHYLQGYYISRPVPAHELLTDSRRSSWAAAAG